MFLPSFSYVYNAHISNPAEAVKKKVQNTLNLEKMRQLHVALLDIISAMNRPQRDDALIREAGIPLDRALFPLLIGIERFGPIGVVDLAERSGRDYTTVSRQVAKLESLGLVMRQPSATDRRVHEAVATEKGKATTDLLDAARERIGRAALRNWTAEEFDDLVRLTRKFADTIQGEVPDV